MERKIQVKNIFKLKEVREYGYLTVFLIISVFFIIFLIRPNLRQIFLAREKVKELSLIKNKYETVINKIIELQSDFEQFRDRYYLINQAVPQSPVINKITVDINEKLEKNNLKVNKIEIKDINLTAEKKKEVESIKIELDIDGSFNDFNYFIRDLIKQRRLKEIESFEITNSKDIQSTESSQLKINLVINSYFLPI